jgi:hypothetical protein
MPGRSGEIGECRLSDGHLGGRTPTIVIAAGSLQQLQDSPTS